jgi:hypothetical protein
MVSSCWLTQKKSILFDLLQNLLNQTQGLAFLSRNFYERYPNFKILRISFCSWNSKKLPKMPSDLFYGEFFFHKTQGFTFLRWNSYRRAPKISKFQNSEYLSLCLELKKVTKNVVIIFSQWIFFNKISRFNLS